MTEQSTRRVVGIDIGGTGVKLGLVAFDRDAVPRVLAERLVTDHSTLDPAALFDRLAEEVRALGGEAPGPPPVALGIGCAGLVDAEHGLLHSSTHLPGWRDVALRDGLSRSTGLPAALANDAACFLEAEWRHGAARGARDALFLTLGTGIGGALLLAGAPYRGAGGLGAEIGHMSIDWNGAPCGCGGRGCLELYVGRKAIERAALLGGLAAEGVTGPAEVSAAAARGDARAIELLAESGRALGLALAGLVNLLEPGVIVVGGGVAEAGAPLLEPARAEMVSRSMVARQSRVRLVRAAFGPRAGLVGAATLGRTASENG